jgi:4'-phosphopantetheinyl transferase
VSGPCEVHVASGRVSEVLRSAPADLQWLSAGERGRLARITADARRQQFLAGRWQARRLLADASGGHPQSWTLDAPDDLPPNVEGHPQLQLSVGHSGDWVAVALAAAAVGIDIEAPRPRRDLEGLIDLSCTQRERALFVSPDPAQRADLFHELWTVKESWLKARREWMAPARLRALEARPADAGEVRTWRGEGHWLALCAPLDAAVRWWTPQPQASRAWQVSPTIKASPAASAHHP